MIGIIFKSIALLILLVLAIIGAAAILVVVFTSRISWSRRRTGKTTIQHQSNMALYQSRGRISDMSEVQSGTSKNGYEWQRMTITLEITGFQGSVFKQVFQVSGDDVNDVLLYNIGDRVEISWSMYAREWNGKWYNNVDLVKISHQEQGNAPAPQAEQEQPLPPAEVDDPQNDFPF